MSLTFEAAVAAHAAGDWATAERGYLAFPASRNARYNLGRLYRQTDRLEEAEAQFRLILQHFPDHALSRRALAMTLLAARRYAEAWPLYEARRQIQAPPEPTVDYPEWQGGPVAGRRLLVVAEQGLGDQLMFGRWLPELRARGAEVVVACDGAAMRRLFEGVGFETSHYGPGGGTLPVADGWVFICSLPFRMAATEPLSAAYLPSSGWGRGIGVATHGNPAHENDARRSLGPAQAARLQALGRDLAPAATGARDFQDTAEIIAGLGLVITVDTSIAHLAAGLGKPCWVLLPAAGLDWRWNDGVRSDWYPQARLFRQRADGDWDTVLDEVSAALRVRDWQAPGRGTV